MNQPESKHKKGDLVIYNCTGNFGNEKDILLHIHSVRYGLCGEIKIAQHWYSGNLLEIKKSGSKGVPQVPVFWTTITNVPEKTLKGLEGLTIDS